jgi:diguanylate cyclase (GGDEF)-like protein
MYKVEGDKTIIGRGQKAQIRLFDDGISREHAQLVIKGDRVILEDLGSTNGTFCNGLKVDKRELSDGDKILVGSTTILKFTYHDNLDEMFQKQMYESALRDGLTKAFNKKYFTDRLESEFTFAIRHTSALALVLFDLDHFKKVNDTYGHQAGDYVLLEVSTLLSAALRAEDVFARYGGEEFAVICRGSDMNQAPIVGERLRKSVEGHKFVYDKTPIPVTISVGVAVLPNPAVKDAGDLIALADQALYKSKNGGRNRVTLYKPES